MLVPYLEGERTPNLPEATGSLHGLTLASTTPAHLARAAFEGLFCGLAAGIDALVEQGVEVRRVLLVGGAAASPATQAIAPAVLGCPVVVPPPSEYVADGAARQAAWVLAGGDAPPAVAAGGGAHGAGGGHAPRAGPVRGGGRSGPGHGLAPPGQLWEQPGAVARLTPALVPQPGGRFPTGGRRGPWVAMG